MDSLDQALLAQLNRTSTEQRFEFAALPEDWWAVVGLAALALTCWTVVWLYRTEGRRGASVRTRFILALIRCVVLAGLAAILLQPVLATYVHRWIDSYCIVLIDDSSSMDLEDRYHDSEDNQRMQKVIPEGASFPVRRADLTAHLLNRDDGAWVEALAKRNRVKLYTFDDSAKLVASVRSAREGNDSSEDDGNQSDSNGELPSDVPKSFATQGSATDLSAALSRSIESLAGAPLAGVVVFSDGGFNRGAPVSEIARFIEEKNIALHVVGVGDPSPPKNVRITEVLSPENAFKDDPFTITAHLASQGMPGETISLELYETDADGAGGATPAMTRSVRIGLDGTAEPAVFNRTRETIGRTIYRVNIPPNEFESVIDDNTKQTSVNIIDDRVRVLLISGNPGWEYRYVSRLLTRDGTFDLSCWLQSADINAVRDGNTIIEEIPATPEELLEYDAVILLDPDPSEFGPGWARSLADMITEHGGGLAFVASRKNTPEFMRDNAVRRIVQLLPVSLDQEADLILNRIGHYQTRSWPVEIPDTAKSHPILSGGDTTNDGAGPWVETPSIYWHYPVLREKPVANVLMRHGNPQMRNSYGSHVLLATQFAGSGRTAFAAFDSSWRWRKQGEEAFNAYWVQMIRYLTEGKLLGAKKRATLLTEGQTFQLGSSINVTARLFDAAFKPLENDSVQATYRGARSKQTFMLNRQSDRPGWYRGQFTPVQTGNYQVEITLPASGSSSSVTSMLSLQVVRPNIEILRPEMNEASLRLLAESSNGGRYYHADEVNQIPEAIPDRHEMTTVKSRPVPLWDRWWTLVGLIGLLCIEWGVRKWARLL